MPVHCPISIQCLEQDEFARLDYQVMPLAFESHTELGRICDEAIYGNDLAVRLEAAGLGPVYREIPITVTHRDFIKIYRLDLVVGGRAIYELKTAAHLVAEHETQVLNYMFLANVRHAKLVNFRNAQVESRFVNTTHTSESRGQFAVDTQLWRPNSQLADFLRECLLGLLEEWGGLLELGIYTEAVTHFLGGEEAVVRMIPMHRNGVPLGNQSLHMLTPDTAFRITAFPSPKGYEHHLLRVLEHSHLNTIQWINLAPRSVQFITLSRSDRA